MVCKHHHGCLLQAMGGFMQNRFLNRANVVQRCKRLEKLGKGKTCHSKNQIRIGTLCCLCQQWSASPGLKHFSKPLAQRPQVLGPPTRRPFSPISSPSCATLLIRDSRCEKLFQNSRPFLTLRHSLSLSPNFTLNTIWECKLSREIVGIDKVVQQFKYSLRLLCTLKQCQTEEYFPNQLKT